jgi:hypothetical protein
MGVTGSNRCMRRWAIAMPCCVALAPVGCRSGPSDPSGSQQDVDVFYGLSIEGKTYPHQFDRLTMGDTTLYHTLVIRGSGEFQAWCGVRRSGVRSIECPRSRSTAIRSGGMATIPDRRSTSGPGTVGSV